MLGRCSKLPFQAILAVIFEHFLPALPNWEGTAFPTELIADLPDYSGAPASV
jgi:hypothetical protein